MAGENCNSCVYFTDHHIMGQCRRFPVFQNRHKTEWCGEHKSPVVVTMTVTDETLTVTETPIKKRGRPPRVLVPLTVEGETT
jgi:hypothetical protein